jgi:uncharacterized damage-inducible protein DinB
MYRRADDFLAHYRQLSESTQKVLDALTDASLGQAVADGHRTLGRIGWHLAQTVPEMMGKTGLRPAGPAEDAPVPPTASAIADGYRTASRSLLEQVAAHWTDDTLDMEDDLYGTKWKRGFTLTALVEHEVHHVGQMTVLMRQAGLRPPGIYGPAQEDWSKMNMAPPAI